MSLRQTLAVSMTALLLPVCVTAVRADDKADLDSTRIIGNRELPKVLYIVPWRQSAPGELLERPMPSVMDEAIQPVDRDTFRRSVRYLGAAVAPPAPAAATAEPQPAPASR